MAFFLIDVAPARGGGELLLVIAVVIIVLAVVVTVAVAAGTFVFLRIRKSRAAGHMVGADWPAPASTSPPESPSNSPNP